MFDGKIAIISCFVYAITLGQTVPTLTSLLKKLICYNYKGKGMKQNSRCGRTKFSQAEQVVLGLLDISLCDNFATSNEWLWSKDERDNSFLAEI